MSGILFLVLFVVGIALLIYAVIETIKIFVEDYRIKDELRKKREITNYVKEIS